ncbi:MAG: hypothetical protein J7L89_09435 [Bacteroidales bacterium]|nr:hypothetical protein [Bacteroidales bacterium]
MSLIEKFYPAVKPVWLVLLAGLMWLAVGIMLCTMGVGWLIHADTRWAWVFGVVGFLAAMVIHHFGFLRIVDRNLGRIRKIDGKYCAFGFMPWKSYFLIAVMMTTGILLRHSSFPKTYLSLIYNGIGLSLALSSIRYFRNLFLLNV